MMQTIVATVATLGFEGDDLYLVGGSVRDLLSGRDINDLDFTTNLSPDEVMERLERVGKTCAAHPFRVSDKCGTIGIHLGGMKVEITPYRKETYERGNRTPDVVFEGVTLAEDLERRDFTVNAMAINCFTDELVDLFDGQGDLDRRCLRAVVDPRQRFAEDPLRMMRACRFAGKLGFYIERETYVALGLCINAIRDVSIERVRDEIMLMLVSDNPTMGLRLMVDCGLLQIVMPELYSCCGVAQPARYHAYDVFDHTMELVRHTPIEPLLRLAALLHDIGKPRCQALTESGVHFYEHHKVGADIARAIMERMHFSNYETLIVTHYVYHHMVPHALEFDARSLRRFIHRHELYIESFETGENVGITAEDLITFACHDAEASGRTQDALEMPIGYRYSELLHKLVDVRVEQHHPQFACPVSGDEIMEHFEIPPGPLVGKIKAAIVEAIVEGTIAGAHDYIGMYEIAKRIVNEEQHNADVA